jgi:hypothetical protein
MKLKWHKTHGAHAGYEAQYGDWQFRAYAWQRGSYSAIAVNTVTRETRQHGRLADEIKTQAAARAWCERVFAYLLLEDQKRGITREVW